MPIQLLCSLASWLGILTERNYSGSSEENLYGFWLASLKTLTVTGRWTN